MDLISLSFGILLYMMNRSGLAGGYLMYPFDEQKSFRAKSNPKKPDKYQTEKGDVCIPSNGFLQT